MQTLDSLVRSGLLGVLLVSVAFAPAAESPIVTAAGVVSLVPRISDLGTGWTERRIVFAIDPLDHPPETVNEGVGRNATNRNRLLTFVKQNMDGAVGHGYFGYGFGNLIWNDGRYDLYLSRYRNRKDLESVWSKTLKRADNRPGPRLGEAAIWLTRKESDDDFGLVFRKGLFVARLDCTAKQNPERLVHLAEVLSSRIGETTEPADAPNSAPPHR